MFPECICKARVRRWGWTETPNGHPLFEMDFDVLSEVDGFNLGAAPKPCEQCTRNWRIPVTTDKAAAWLMRSVGEFGYDRDNFDGLNPDGADPFDFKGKEFFARCQHEDFNGKARERWSVYSPPVKLASAKLQDLNKRFGRVFAETNEQ